MDHTAEAGYASYYLDQRGYGNSTRPELMQQPTEENEPFARAETTLFLNGTEEALKQLQQEPTN